MEPVFNTLPSDHLKRLDLINLKKGIFFLNVFYILSEKSEGDLTAAQIEKENLENLQRRDAKLRREFGEKKR